MFHSPRAPYSTSNNLKKIMPNFYMRPYILSHVVLTFFASDPPPPRVGLANTSISTNYDQKPPRSLLSTLHTKATV